MGWLHMETKSSVTAEPVLVIMDWFPSILSKRVHMSTFTTYMIYLSMKLKMMLRRNQPCLTSKPVYGIMIIWTCEQKLCKLCSFRRTDLRKVKTYHCTVYPPKYGLDSRILLLPPEFDPYAPTLLRWPLGKLTIARVPMKRPGVIWINTWNLSERMIQTHQIQARQSIFTYFYENTVFWTATRCCVGSSYRKWKYALYQFVRAF